MLNLNREQKKSRGVSLLVLLVPNWPPAVMELDEKCCFVWMFIDVMANNEGRFTTGAFFGRVMEALNKKVQLHFF